MIGEKGATIPMGLCLRRVLLQYPMTGVAGFDRNQWQLSIGISGNLRLESVAGFDRNQWQLSTGIRTGVLWWRVVPTGLRMPSPAQYNIQGMRNWQRDLTPGRRESVGARTGGSEYASDISPTHRMGLTNIAGDMGRRASSLSTAILLGMVCSLHQALPWFRKSTLFSYVAHIGFKGRGF